MDTMVLVVGCVCVCLQASSLSSPLLCWLGFNQESAPELSCVQVDLFGRLSHHREFRDREARLDFTLSSITKIRQQQKPLAFQAKKNKLSKPRFFSRKQEGKIIFKHQLWSLALKARAKNWIRIVMLESHTVVAKKATQAKIKRNIKKLFSLAARPSLALFWRHCWSALAAARRDPFYVYERLRRKKASYFSFWN